MLRGCHNVQGKQGDILSAEPGSDMMMMVSRLPFSDAVWRCCRQLPWKHCSSFASVISDLLVILFNNGLSCEKPYKLLIQLGTHCGFHIARRDWFIDENVNINSNSNNINSSNNSGRGCWSLMISAVDSQIQRVQIFSDFILCRLEVSEFKQRTCSLSLLQIYISGDLKYHKFWICRI